MFARQCGWWNGISRSLCDGGDGKRDIVIRCWRAWNGMERCEVVSLVVSDHCFNESEMCWIWVSL